MICQRYHDVNACPCESVICESWQSIRASMDTADQYIPGQLYNTPIRKPPGFFGCAQTRETSRTVHTHSPEALKKQWNKNRMSNFPADGRSRMQRQKETATGARTCAEGTQATAVVKRHTTASHIVITRIRTRSASQRTYSLR